MDSVPGVQRIRFTSPHPHDFTEDVVAAMAECPAVCEHIHFPLQSGSDRVLGMMRRSYRAARYLGWLETIRAAIPDVAVTTDVIVGFPGETEQDFEYTLDVVRVAAFVSAYTFQYSPRPGTAAGSYPDQVPKEVVQERFDRLLALQQEISVRKNREMLGRTVEVLIEGQGRKGNLQGRTRTNKIVHLAGSWPAGSFVDVEISEAHPHHLTGRPVAAQVPA